MSLTDDTTLLVAAQNGDVNRARRLLQIGADVNARSFPDGWTALQLATKNNHADMVTLLLENGAEHTATHGHHHIPAPMNLAVQAGNVELIRLMMAHGVSLNDSESDHPPVYYAVEADRTDILRVLLELGAKPYVKIGSLAGDGILHLAAEYGRLDAARLLLEYDTEGKFRESECAGAFLRAARKGHGELAELLRQHAEDSRFEEMLWAAESGSEERACELLATGLAPENPKDQQWFSLLQTAAKRGFVRLLRELLLVGVSLQPEYLFGMSPLSLAVQGGHGETVRVLLEHGTLPLEAAAQHSYAQTTALHVAARNGNTTLLEMLLDAGAPVDIPDSSSETPLHAAARENQPGAAAFLLGRGADVDKRSSELKFTPLHYAAEYGGTAVATLLLEHGAEVDARSSGEVTPLHKAAENGRADMVRFLLAHGANPNAESWAGDRPIGLAASKGSTEVVAILLEHGVEPPPRDSYGADSLLLAVRGGHTDTVRFLLGHGMRPDDETLTRKNGSPLYRAVEQGHLELVKLLLEHGASPEGSGGGEILPLHLAVQQGDAAAVRLLLEHGANPNCADCTGRTALSMAAETGNTAVAALLLEHGANREGEFFPPLCEAAYHGHLEVAKLLLDHGANPKARFMDNTALERALGNNHAEVARLLMAHGAGIHDCEHRESCMQKAAAALGTDALQMLLEMGENPGAKGPDCPISPFFVAVGMGLVPNARMLLERGADVNERDGEGSTPLHRAARAANAEMAVMLLEHGADVNARDNEGRTPLFDAVSAPHLETVDILLEHGADILARNNQGRNVLHEAAQISSEDSDILTMAALLLKHGADMAARDNGGKTPPDMLWSIRMRDKMRKLAEGVPLAELLDPEEAPIALKVTMDDTPPENA